MNRLLNLLPFWLRREWFEYMLAKADTPRFCSWSTRLWCRFKNHPAGEIFFNVYGDEPDHRCRNCGDFVG